jgi:predicted nucleic acid-binding Zn ribbon protein
MFLLKYFTREPIMPVYQFICEKHGGFEKITIKAEWGDIRCPKCGDKSKVCKECNLEPKGLSTAKPQLYSF